MARIVSTKSNPIYGFKIVNHLKEGGVETNTFYIGESITDLKYVDNEEVVTVSGKIVDVNIYFRSATNKVSESRKSYLTSDASVVSITIDHSRENESDVDVIKAKEIIEFNASGEVTKVEVLPVVKVEFENLLSDETTNETVFEEEQEYYGMTLVKADGKEIEGNFRVAAFAYTFTKTVTKSEVYGLVLDNGKIGFVVRFDQIKTLGTQATIIDDPEAAAEALQNIEDGQILVIKTDTPIESTIRVEEGATATVKLGKSKIIVPEPVNNRSIYAIDNYGTLTLEGGVIEARGIENFGEMTLIDVDITARDTNGGAAVWNEGDLTIKGASLHTTYEGSVQENNGPGCLNNRGKCVIESGSFVSVNNRCYTIISSGNIEILEGSDIECKGAHGGLCIDSGFAVINSGTYVSKNFYGLYVSNDGTGTPEKAQVVVNGGDFTGKTTSAYVGSDSGLPVDSVINITNGTFHNKLTVQSNVVEGAGIKVSGGRFADPVPAEYCAEGFGPTSEPDAEGYYTVEPIKTEETSEVTEP